MMMRFSKKRLISLFSAFLLILLPLSDAFAADADENLEALQGTAATDMPLSSGELDEAPFILREDTALREQNVKHFLLTDGSCTAVVYDEPVHRQKEGEWVEIDNSLTAAVLIGEPQTRAVKRFSQQTQKELQEYQLTQNAGSSAYCTDYLENTENDFKVQLPASISDRAPVFIQYGGHTLRFCFEDIASAAAVANQPVDQTVLAAELQNKLAAAADHQERARIQNDYAAAITKSRSSVFYAGVQSDIDLRYRIIGEKLKEDLVLHELPEATSFAFHFTYQNLHAVLNQDNSVTFYDNSGEAVFLMAAPYMFDSADGYSTDILVTLEETGSGCRYTLTPSRDWLANPARVYPVTLDPTITTSQDVNAIQDAGVQESVPDQNYQAYNRMYVGSDANEKEGRIYFRLAQWPSATGLTSANIVKAELRLNYYPTASYQTGNDITINVCRVNSAWDSGEIKWNNQTNITATYISSLPIKDCRGKTSGCDTFDVTSWVKARYASPSSDYGIRLQPSELKPTMNRVCYISSDYTADTTLRPIITIAYKANTAGQAPGIVSGRIYCLRNANSGKYLTVPSSTNGTDLTQSSFSGSDNQKFYVAYDSSRQDYAFIPLSAAISAIEIEGNSANNDAPVQIWTSQFYGEMVSQCFKIVQNSNGSYRILSYASNYTKAVVVKNASTAENWPIVQYTDNGSTNGHWYFETSSGETAGISSGQVYYLRNANSGKYLNAPGSANGTDLTQSGFNGGQGQQFKVQFNSSTRDYSLIPMCATGSAVEITNQSAENDAVVQIWAKASSGGVMNSQRFRIVQNANGSYRLQSYASNYTKAVVVKNGSTAENWPIVQYTDNGSTNGHWYFVKGHKTLDTPLLGQERDNWCWAASALMAARTGGTSTKTQAQIVEHIKGSVVDKTATSDEIRQAANFASGTTDYYVTYSELTEEQLVTEINAGRPVIVVRAWYDSLGYPAGAHATVVYGYQLSGSDLVFKIHDPLPKNEGSSYNWTYSNIVHGTDSGYWKETIRRH